MPYGTNVDSKASGPSCSNNNERFPYFPSPRYTENLQTNKQNEKGRPNIVCNNYERFPYFPSPWYTEITSQTNIQNKNKSTPNVEQP
jgi:hypothetical protein